MAPPVKIQWRCPHTRFDVTDEETINKAHERLSEQGKEHTAFNVSKMARAVARRTMFDVPADAVWLPTQDVRHGKHGILEVFETGTYYTILTCPVCGDERKIVTDQVVV